MKRCTDACQITGPAELSKHPTPSMLFVAAPAVSWAENKAGALDDELKTRTNVGRGFKSSVPGVPMFSFLGGMSK